MTRLVPPEASRQDRAACGGAVAPTLIEILQKTEAFLRERGVDSPRLEAQLLVAFALSMERIALFTDAERPLTPDEVAAIREVVRRRGRREPLQYITGERGFWTLDLLVRPGVLVPRPDTERLVEAALEWIPKDEPQVVVDVGCGSGAIGLALASERPLLKVWCLDLSPEALENTRQNVAKLGLQSRVAIVKSDLLSALPADREVDWVLSNPPYIASGEIAGLMPEVRDHEPRLALDGGADGLAVYRRLIPLAARRARRGVLMEIGHDQATAVANLFREQGLNDVAVLQDLGRRDRVVRGRSTTAAPARLDPPRTLDGLHYEPIAEPAALDPELPVFDLRGER